MEFLEGLVEKGRNPPALINKPVLPSYLSYYMESFNVMSSRRPVNNIEGAIPLSEIWTYLNMYPWYDLDKFIKLIIFLDNAYLEFRLKDDNKEVDFRSNH